MSIYEYDEEKTLKQMREEGYDAGYEMGEKRINELNQKLAELGRVQDIIKAAQDLEYQKELLEEFKI